MHLPEPFYAMPRRGTLLFGPGTSWHLLEEAKDRIRTEEKKTIAKGRLGELEVGRHWHGIGDSGWRLLVAWSTAEPWHSNSSIFVAT